VLDVGIRKEFAARRLLEPLADRRAGFVIERNEARALVGHRQQHGVEQLRQHNTSMHRVAEHRR
jgi:hypothetical protein